MGTVRDSADSVESAIDFGTIASQNAPPGHPIFAAVASAKLEQAAILDRIPWYSTTGGEATPDVVVSAKAAVDAIYDAAADIRTDPDAMLPRTVQQAPGSLPWGPIAVGVATAIAAIVYLHATRRR
jgi:hypothetical protein